MSSNPQTSLAFVDDSVLVSMVRYGDHSAFNEIDRRYRSQLCQYLKRYTHCFAQAEDLTQQTLLRAFQLIDQLRAGEKIGAWLFRIAFRLMIDETRKRQPNVSLISEHCVGNDIAADVTVMADEEKTLIWQTVKQVLTHEEYNVIELRYVKNLGIAEIAKIIGHTQVSVRVILHRARNRLLPYLTER